MKIIIIVIIAILVLIFRTYLIYCICYIWC